MKSDKVFLTLLLVLCCLLAPQSLSMAQTRTGKPAGRSAAVSKSAPAKKVSAARQAQTRKPQATARKPQTAAQRAQAQKLAAARKRQAQREAEYSAQFKEVAYTITGKAHDFPEGEWVKLCQPGEKGLQTVDSVRLQGEDFSFSGKTLSVPRMAYIVMGEGAKKTLVELFLEQGNISVDITASKRIDRVSGTLNNDIYAPYRDSINLVYTDLYNCLKESYNLKNSKDDRDSYRLGADSMRQRLVDISYEFASKNLNNWVGIYLFAEYYKRFTLEQDRHLLTLVPRRYAELPIIGEIRKYCK